MDSPHGRASGAGLEVGGPVTTSQHTAISPANMRARCEALITAMVGKDLTDKWWNGANRAFGGKTPEQMYSVAPDVVYAYLMRSAEGEL